ncbi:MAG TPA: PAS domain-containing protein [Caldithrix abyssi]|uniref:histidine kinase n=1 Tax=Caldithrix abyssi TaxID=187145 RepID=A0A7V4WWA7_CALAY|nr:PAS domain-containing protein [Caldithrix abyssi]
MLLKKIKTFEVSPNRRINYPIVGLIAATVLLLVIVAVLTYLNYNRETKLLKDHLKRQGETLIRAMEAGARTGMMEMRWGGNQIQTLFIESAKGPNIDRIMLVDENKDVIIDSHTANKDRFLSYFSKPETKEETVTLIFEKSENTNVFRLIRYFVPLGNNQRSNSGGGWMSGNWMMDNCNDSITQGSQYIVLDLKMQEYDAAKKEDVRWAIISGLILFMLGTASLYFLLLAQNYYAVGRTLKTMESYTRNVVESMADGLISLDKHQRIETINRYALRLLKLEGENVKGKPLGEVLNKCTLPESFAEGQDIIQKQVECHLNDDTIIPLNTTWSRLKDETGMVIGWVVILRDLRDIRSLEKQIQRSERLASLGRMAAGIAHEIRNPLGSIKGFAQYFRNKFAEGSEDRNYASVMIDEVDRLNRVIQDLLNFAKPQEPHLSSVDIRSVIRHSLKLAQPDIKAKRIKIVENFLPDPPPFIRADADMLTQVFLNLFLNAIEAMEKEGQLEIGMNTDGNKINITIRDNGSGISQENLSKIFDPFFTTKKEGTGLGLAIVYRIVENHNGSIEVESEPGEGTTFHLVFSIDK